MGKNRFVRPHTIRIDISDGDWIEIKERLTWGEALALAASGMGTYRDGDDGKPELKTNIANRAIERVLIWVVDWSFENETGKRISVNRDSVCALDPDTAREIHEVIDKREEELDQEKKVTNGETLPP